MRELNTAFNRLGAFLHPSPTFSQGAAEYGLPSATKTKDGLRWDSRAIDSILAISKRRQRLNNSTEDFGGSALAFAIRYFETLATKGEIVEGETITFGRLYATWRIIEGRLLHSSSKKRTSSTEQLRDWLPDTRASLAFAEAEDQIAARQVVYAIRASLLSLGHSTVHIDAFLLDSAGIRCSIISRLLTERHGIAVQPDTIRQWRNRKFGSFAELVRASLGTSMAVTA